jgi:phosphoglycolate phosphatase-like HAD superfamily hydrolase
MLQNQTSQSLAGTAELRVALAKSALVVLLAVLSHAALAASSDADFRVLTKDRKFEAAEALARERVSKDPKDDVALWYWARLAAGDTKKRNELIPKVERCVADLPQSGTRQFCMRGRTALPSSGQFCVRRCSS